jgi:hypothetical protein
MLNTTEVDRKRNRVLLTATVPASLFTALASSENSAAQSEAEPASDASK